MTEIMVYDAKELDQILMCNICEEKLKDPRILPCGPSFCNRCILSESETETSLTAFGTKTFKCQKCGKKHNIPQDGFPENIILKKVVQLKSSDEIASRLKEAEDEKESLKKKNETNVELLEKVLKEYKDLENANKEALETSNTINTCLVSRLEEEEEAKKEAQALLNEVIENKNVDSETLRFRGEAVKKNSSPECLIS